MRGLRRCDTGAVLNLWPLHLLDTNAATSRDASRHCALSLLNSAIHRVEEAGGQVEAPVEAGGRVQAVLVADRATCHVCDPSQPGHLGGDGRVQEEGRRALLISPPLAKSSHTKAALSSHIAIPGNCPIRPCLQDPAIFLARSCREPDWGTRALRALHPVVEAGQPGDHLASLLPHLGQLATLTLAPGGRFHLGHVLLPGPVLPLPNLFPISDNLVATGWLNARLEGDSASSLGPLLLLLLVEDRLPLVHLGFRGGRGDVLDPAQEVDKVLEERLAHHCW